MLCINEAVLHSRNTGGICCELVQFLWCKTTSKFGLVTVADLILNTRYGNEFTKSKPLSVVQLQSYRHAEIVEMLSMHLMLFAPVNLRNTLSLKRETC